MNMVKMRRLAFFMYCRKFESELFANLLLLSDKKIDTFALFVKL